MSVDRHLAYHPHGHGFDVAHIGVGLAAVELVLCLTVLTVWVARPAGTGLVL